MAEAHIKQILEQFETRDSHAAWAAFIDEYAPIIFQVIRHFEADSDDASDCFQFVCERLCEGRFRRLRRYKSDGPAKFSTWLRAVVRNLCLDRRRTQFGRRRIFRSIGRLSELDQEIFSLVHERNASEQEVLVSLAPRFPHVTSALVTEAIERINNTLTTNQIWRLRARSAVVPNPRTGTSQRSEPTPVDSAPNPEARVIFAERSRILDEALRRLSSAERLLIKLRFEEELTLEQIAKLLDLGNAQRVDRQIKQILATLKVELA